MSLHRPDELSHADWQAWSALLMRQPGGPRAFMAPAFFRAAAAHFKGVRVLVLRRAGAPVGFLPVQAGAGLLALGGVHEPVGGVMSDYFGLVAQPDTRIAIGATLGQAGINALAFTHLDESQLAFGLTGAQPRTGLRTHFGADGKQFWEALRGTDKKLVADTERRERKLVSECGALHFELSSSTPDADLQELVALKQSQYGRTGKLGAPLFDERNVALLRTLLRSTDPACAGLLSVLRVEGKLVAAHFGLQCHTLLHFWFPVYAPAFHAYSPGRLLLRHIIHAGAERGIETIDRGEGDTPAKRDFATDQHLFYRGLWCRPGLPGLLGRAAFALQWRIQDRQERRINVAIAQTKADL